MVPEPREKLDVECGRIRIFGEVILRTDREELLQTFAIIRFH